MTSDNFSNWLATPDRPPLVMGVLNVTPDSFSDGGRYSDLNSAVTHAREMVAGGASIIDVGGESTRPGSERVGAEEQIRRVVPVIERLAGLGLPALISIDTTRQPVARAALRAGAATINDISAGTDDPAILSLAAETRVPIILMHMQGQPATMQVNPSYGNVTEDVARALAGRLRAARDAGVPEERILLDPGIGFGKSAAHNLELLRNLRRIAAIGRPLVLGTSRKGFLGRIAGESDPASRVMSTAATVAWCVANGAGIVRVHDVEAMSRIVKVIHAIQFGWEDSK